MEKPWSITKELKLLKIEMEKQSQGNLQMKRIRSVHNSYMKSKREAAEKKRRLEKLIARFPKVERPLYEEQLLKYKSKLV